MNREAAWRAFAERYGITPKTVRIGASTPKGYARADLTEDTGGKDKTTEQSHRLLSLLLVRVTALIDSKPHDGRHGDMPRIRAVLHPLLHDGVELVVSQLACNAVVGLQIHLRVTSVGVPVLLLRLVDIPPRINHAADIALLPRLVQRSPLVAVKCVGASGYDRRNSEKYPNSGCPHLTLPVPLAPRATTLHPGAGRLARRSHTFQLFPYRRTSHSDGPYASP
jgi:hypothetical protein